MSHSADYRLDGQVQGDSVRQGDATIKWPNDAILRQGGGGTEIFDVGSDFFCLSCT